MKEFSSSDITRITGIKLNRIQPWMERGFITPSIKVATGTGTRNKFSQKDIDKIDTMRKLIDAGISRSLDAHFVNSPGWKLNDPFIIKLAD